MVLSPPLCLIISNLENIENISSKIWKVKLTFDDQQTTGIGSYGGNNVSINQWIGLNNQIGFAYKIVKIYTNLQSSSSVTCDIEDVDNWNRNKDSSGDGNGGPGDGNFGFVFELNDNNEPAFTAVATPPNLTWTDNIVGRFNSLRTGGGSSGSSTNSVIIRAPKADINFDFRNNTSNITCPARVGTYISGGSNASSFSIQLNSNYYSVANNFPMFTGNVAFYVGNPANSWTFNQVKFGSVSSTAQVRTQISSANYPNLILEVDGLHTGTFPSATNDMSNGYSLITTLNFLN